MLIISVYTPNAKAQLYINGNSNFYVNTGAQVQVNMNTSVTNAASILSQVGTSYLRISGNLTTNGTVNLDKGFTLGGHLILNTPIDFTTNSTTITFYGPSSQTITSPSGTVTFYEWVIDKTGGYVYTGNEVVISNSLRLISNAVIDIGLFNLTMGINAIIYSDYGTAKVFSKTQCIYNSQGINSGYLIRKINPAASLPLPTLRFPLGTPGSTGDVYTPAEINLISGSLSSGCQIAIKAINNEHPMVEKNNVSLKKYWLVSSQNVSINANGANVLFYWDASEEAGNVGEYKVLWFNPSYPNPSGYWRVDPGVVNVSDFNNRFFYSQQVSTIDGDWTTGEDGAGRATYYSITDNGDYNTPGTWSKVSFVGPPSTTAPNKQSDRVRINLKVRITAPVSNVGELSVESGGILRFETNDAIAGNIFRVEDNGGLEIGGQYGITASTTGATGGNVQTNTRTFSQNAVYKYISTTQDQVSGDAVPSPVRGIVCDKAFGRTVTLSKDIAISDSLVINVGTLDIGNYSINGNSSGRTFTMRGGELVIRTTYPINYLTNTFTSGTITFDGTGNVTIPSSGSDPAVAQYNSLTIRGNRAAGTSITFQSAGDINIIEDFDISALNFAGAITQKFFTDGSTVIFKKNGGVQNIQCRPASPVNDLVNLSYYNLKIAGTGIKQLNSSVASTTFNVTNLITLESSTFASNYFDMKVSGNWLNTGGIFDPATATVDFNSPVLSFTNTITSRNQFENTFNNMIVSGPGNVQPLDDIRIRGNLTFLSSSNLTMSSSTVTPTTLTLLGNWTNQGGTFSAGGSTVYFNGTNTQIMQKYLAGNETFYKMTVDNPNNVDVSAVGTSSDNGIIISNTLSLPLGNVRSRGRHATIPQGAVLSRPGANPGHIDGTLRRYVDPSLGSVLFEVGYDKRYTSTSLTFNGSGGTAGLVSVTADTLTNTTSPVTVGINPAGSGMSDARNVRRQWTTAIPTGSTFSLGTMTYNIFNSFINGISPNGDLRNGADPLYFETRLYSGATWIAPNRFGSPQTGTRTATTTEYRQISQWGTFIIGEPSQLSFYSINNNNWTIASSWSTQSYTGPASAIPPTNDALVYIGNSKTITLNASPVTANGIVTIDSSGVLIFGANILSGTGEFRLTKDGTVSLGDAAGITTAGATGNVQVTTRSYNYNNHNRGNYVFTGGAAQVTGNGLPGIIATLTVSKIPGSAVTLSNASNTVSDSIYIQLGTLASGANNISLVGNLRISGVGILNAGTGTYNFIGNSSQTITALNDITFNNLTINNATLNSSIIFMPTVVGFSQMVTVNAALTFAAGNLAYINLSPSSSTATGPSYNQGEWIMTIANPGGSVVRTGIGHVYGELRKWIPRGAVGNATTGGGTGITYEVGVGNQYNPFTVRLSNTPANDVAGYCGIQVLGFKQPEIVDLTTIGPPAYSYPPERAISKYWRMVSPATNGWVRGDRIIAVNGQYLNPQDIPGGALIMCFDFAFWKGPLSTDWQRLRPPSAAFNDGTGSTCGDRNQIGAGGATYSPNATTVSTMGYNIGTANALGNLDLGLIVNNRILNGDWVLAQQGPGITYYYSRQNGNWTDSSTWSTVNYSSAVNNGSFLDGITQVGRYPMRRTDIALVGDGHIVTLDANIGNGWPNVAATPEFHEQRLGSLTIETTAGGRGKLILGTNVIRASVFELKDSGIVETGAEDGFHVNTARGNLQREYSGATISRNFNYNGHITGNYEFTAKGRISETYNNIDFRYCSGTGFTTGSGYISRVRVSAGAAFGVPFFDHADNRQSQSAWRYFPDKCITLTAGSQYTMRIILANTGSPATYYGMFWFDQDFDGLLENIATERYPSAAGRQFNLDSAYAADITFTVPAGTVAGTTMMRIAVRNSNATLDPCIDRADAGEVQDYTINIVNNGYLNTFTQNTGGAIPLSIGSVTANAVNSSSTITQTIGHIVKDSILLTSGTYNPNTQSLRLMGEFINNNNQNAFGGGVQGTLTFDSTLTQNIKGSSSTSFYNVMLDKPSGTVQLKKNTTINNQLTFNKDNYLRPLNNDLIFGPSALAVSPGAGSFGGTRMILSEGSSTIGSIIKQYTGAAGAKSYFFPVGVGTTYNPANINITGNYTVSPSVALKLKSGLHPNRMSNNILSKYWNVITSGISNVSANSLSFTYVPGDVNGNQSLYIPGLYKTNNQWEINLGTNPSANPSPISITNSLYLDGDWTAGEASGFFIGRIFWSRNTGNWNVGSNWSNENHTGVPSAYYPGQIYNRDTVIIDGHTLTYNISSDLIDSLQIGGSSNTASALSGVLQIGNAPVNKLLTIYSNLGVLTDGEIRAAVGGNNKDTLSIFKNLRNISTTVNGVDLYTDANNYTVLRFTSPSSSTITASSSTISGEGTWAPMGPVVLDKVNGFSDTLLVASNSFAAQTGSVPEYLFYLNKGILTNVQTGNLWLSGGNNVVSMQPYTGLNILNGAVSTSDDLISNVNTRFDINGGNLNVGNAINEYFLYNTGTTYNQNGGIVNVAGCFTRNGPNDKIYFNLNSGTFTVMTYGNNDATLTGFDISKNSSTFSMSGGMIDVASGTTGASADFKVVKGASDNGIGMAGGTLQTGHPTMPVATPTEPVKLGGNMPVWDVHATRNGVKTYIAEQVFIIKNNLTIDNSHTFSLNTNTVELRGNLQNDGIYYDPGGIQSNPWLLVFNQSNSQTITNNEAGGLKLYRMKVDKPAGALYLGNTANSNLLIRNSLEFPNTNVVNINARNNNKYVEFNSNVGGTDPQVLRNGLGHIDGLVYRYFPTGAKSLLFPIGATLNTEYRPVTFEAVGTGGTAGLVGAVTSLVDHSAIADPPVKLINYVHRYWTISNNGFDLGANRTYTLTTTYLPGDPVTGPTTYYEHHLYTPALPAAGTWKRTTTTARTATFVTSTSNTEYGDYVVGEPSGYAYWSYSDGTWDGTNTAIWSLDSYTSKVTPVPGPPGNSDVVHIGNSRTITVPETYSPEVRILSVEKNDGKPGTLYVQGQFGSIETNAFVLEDSASLGMHHVSGITADGSAGAILSSNVPSYGNSRYIYNGINGGQVSGRGLPNNIISLTINNVAPTNTVFLSNDAAGSPDPYLNISEDLRLINGTLNFGSRSIRLYRDMVLQNTTKTNPLTKNFIFNGPSNHTLALENQDGVNYYDLDLAGGYIYVTKNTVSPTAQVYVAHTLNLSSASIINVRNADRKVIIQNGGNVNRTGSGYVDGYLQKVIPTDAGTYTYEIGNGTSYTPATITMIGSGGTSGAVDGINITPVPYSPNSGNRMDPAHSVPRYWSLNPVTGGTFAMGGRTANVNLQFPASELATVTPANAVIRRMSVPAEVPLWSERNNADLNWNVGIASVELSAGATKWAGLGDFYIGEKSPRRFYSVATGNWNLNTTWTFNSNHLPPVCPQTDDIPYATVLDNKDVVEIGLNHVVTLNVPNQQLDSLLIINNSQLDLLANSINSTTGTGAFILDNNAFLSSSLGTFPNNSLTNFSTYYLSETSTMDFYGALQTILPNPFGLPDAQGYGNVLLRNGTKNVTAPVYVRLNLTNQSSSLNISTLIDALHVRGSVINSSSILNDGVIEIGE